MRKIYFGPKGTVNWHEPFWKPWGCLGCLGRLLLYLLLLLTLMFLLSMFKMCSCSNPFRPTPTEITNPTGENPNPHVDIDTMIDIPRNIPNPGENLPNPDDNYIPPYDDGDIVQDSLGQQTVGDRLNVILDSDAEDETFRQFADEFKQLYPGDEYTIRFYDPLTKALQIEVPTEERDAMIQNLPQQITDINFLVFPESVMGSFQSNRPNDPAFQYPDYTWHFAPIQAYEAWEITKGSPDVTVAIIDSYFDLNHDELNSDRVVSPFCVPRRSGNVAPPQEGCADAPFKHGSLVACTTLGNMDNNRGTAGIAPNCKFMPISAGHQFTSMTLLQGLLYAIYKGANVVNISAGDAYPEDSPIYSLTTEEQIQLSQEWRKEEEAVWDYAFDLANARNVTVVWAAGNENLYTALDPSKRGDRSIKVSAVDTNLQKASFSNFGNFEEHNVEESTISAPGVNIFGACPYNDYIPLEWGMGTSFSAPIVTGAVALMKSLNPDLSTPDIIQILRETGKPIDSNPEIGKLLQIKDALLRVQNGDEYANMEEIQNDHSQFLGLWESTQTLHKTSNGQATDEMIRLYFKITSESGGQIIYHEESTNLDFPAPLSIQWEQDKIVLTQTAQANNPNAGNHYVVATYFCTPGEDQRAECYHSSQYGTTTPYYLRKVNQSTDD
ncbi:MAG: S8 family serine peptidase [Prevotella sp.]|nr:S8 family serine peptidase [Prevotella sp.]